MTAYDDIMVWWPFKLWGFSIMPKWMNVYDLISSPKNIKPAAFSGSPPGGRVSAQARRCLPLLAVLLICGCCGCICSWTKPGTETTTTIVQAPMKEVPKAYTPSTSLVAGNLTVKLPERTTTTSTSSTSSTTTTIPLGGVYNASSPPTLDPMTVKLLMNCHATSGASVYQKGYDDSCDWMLTTLKLRKTKYASGPSVGAQGDLADSTPVIKFPFPHDTFTLNNSIFRVQLWDGGRQIDLKNCTGESLAAPLTWKVIERIVPRNTSSYYNESEVIYDDG